MSGSQNYSYKFGGKNLLLPLTGSSGGGRGALTVYHTTVMLGLLMFQSAFTFLRNCLSNDVLERDDY